MSGFILDWIPTVSSYTETGVDTNDGGYLVFAATLPDTVHFLHFLSYETNADDRGCILGLENTAASDGIKADNSNSDTFSNPQFDIPINGATNEVFNSSANYTIGDRMNILVSGTISGTVATTKIVIWDATSGTATTVHDSDSGTGATAFGWDTVYGPTLPALFASAGGQRPIDLTTYRWAYWDDADLTGAPPDIESGTVQDNFFNSSTGALVDPATSHTAYGTPIYDLYGNATTLNAGTNSGSGSDWTKNGTAFT